MAGPGSSASDAEPWDQRLAAMRVTNAVSAIRQQQQRHSTNADAMRWGTQVSTYEKLQYDDDELLEDGELPSLATYNSPRSVTRSKAPAIVSPASERRRFWAQMTEDDRSYGPDDEMQSLREERRRAIVESKMTDEELEDSSKEGVRNFCGETFTALEALCGGKLQTTGSETDTFSLLPMPRIRSISSLGPGEQEQTAIEVEYLEPTKNGNDKRLETPPATTEQEMNVPTPQLPTETSRPVQKKGKLAARAKKAMHTVQQSRRHAKQQNAVDVAESIPASNLPMPTNGMLIPDSAEIQEATPDIPTDNSIEDEDRSVVEPTEPADSQVSVTKKKYAALSAIAKKAKDNFHSKKGKSQRSGAHESTPRDVTSSHYEEKKSSDDIYTSFTATEKRMFIKLINSGVPAVEATAQVANDRRAALVEGATRQLSSEESWRHPEPQYDKSGTELEPPLETASSDLGDKFPRSGKQYYDAIEREQEEEQYIAQDSSLNSSTATSKLRKRQNRFFPGGKVGFEELKNTPTKSAEESKEMPPTADTNEAASDQQDPNPRPVRAVLPATETPKTQNSSKDRSTGDVEQASAHNERVPGTRNMGVKIAKYVSRYQKMGEGSPQTKDRYLPNTQPIDPPKNEQESVLPAPSGASEDDDDASRHSESMLDVTSGNFSEQTPSAGGASVYTMGTNVTERTGYTHSTRTRRPGAAKSRLAAQKLVEAESMHKRGWHDTIKAAAASTNRKWDPKVGWVDYEEPQIDLTGTAPDANTSRLKLDLSKLAKPSTVDQLTIKSQDRETKTRDIVKEKLQEEDKALFESTNEQNNQSADTTLRAIGSDDMEISVETGPHPSRRLPSQLAAKSVPRLEMSKRDTSPLRLERSKTRRTPDLRKTEISKPTVAPSNDVQDQEPSSPSSRGHEHVEAESEQSQPADKYRQDKPSEDSIEQSGQRTDKTPELKGSFTAAGWMTFLGKKVRAESEASAFKSEVEPGFRINGQHSRENKPSDRRSEKLSTSLNISDISPINPGEDSSDGEETYGSSMYGPSTTELRSGSLMKRLSECAAPVMASKQLNGLAPVAICGRPEHSEDGSYLRSTLSGSTMDYGSNPISGIGDGQMKPRAVSAPKLRSVGSSSVASEDFGAKAAYLDAVAIKAAVSGSRRTRSNRRGRSFGGSSIVSGASEHSEKWVALLEKRRESGASPLSSRHSSADVSRAAEKYASAKVGEMMEMARLSTRSNTVSRSRGFREELDKKLQIDRSMNAAAEELAAARVQAMMAAMSGDGNEQHGEI